MIMSRDTSTQQPAAAPGADNAPPPLPVTAEAREQLVERLLAHFPRVPRERAEEIFFGLVRGQFGVNPDPTVDTPEIQRDCIVFRLVTEEQRPNRAPIAQVTFVTCGGMKVRVHELEMDGAKRWVIDNETEERYRRSVFRGRLQKEHRDPVTGHTWIEQLPLPEDLTLPSPHRTGVAAPRI